MQNLTSAVFMAAPSIRQQWCIVMYLSVMVDLICLLPKSTVLQWVVLVMALFSNTSKLSQVKMTDSSGSAAQLTGRFFCI